ncbi:uncharacterized protein [Pseudorca crassidens]|uniref:uncharacterized protein n=1 Tax=Pseudorca crassidens TaxID=82174 RepID=UPI00352E9A50
MPNVGIEEKCGIDPVDAAVVVVQVTVPFLRAFGPHLSRKYEFVMQHELRLFRHNFIPLLAGSPSTDCKFPWDLQQQIWTKPPRQSLRCRRRGTTFGRRKREPLLSVRQPDNSGGQAAPCQRAEDRHLCFHPVLQTRSPRAVCRPRGGKRRAVRSPAAVTPPRKRGFLALVRVDRPRPSVCWWPEPPGRPSRAGGPGGRRLEGYGLSGLTGALAGPPSREWGFVWPAAVHGRARCPPLQPDSRCRESGPGPRRAWQPDWPGSARSPLPSSPAGRRQPRVPVLGSRVVVRAPSERMQAARPKT